MPDPSVTPVLAHATHAVGASLAIPLTVFGIGALTLVARLQSDRGGATAVAVASPASGESADDDAGNPLARLFVSSVVLAAAVLAILGPQDAPNLGDVLLRVLLPLTAVLAAVVWRGALPRLIGAPVAIDGDSPANGSGHARWSAVPAVAIVGWHLLTTLTTGPRVIGIVSLALVAGWHVGPRLHPHWWRLDPLHALGRTLGTAAPWSVAGAGPAGTVDVAAGLAGRALFGALLGSAAGFLAPVRDALVSASPSASRALGAALVVVGVLVVDTALGPDRRASWWIGPIAAGLAVALYGAGAVFVGVLAVALASDPLGRGVDLFGTADWTASVAIYENPIAFTVPLSALVGAGVLAITTMTPDDESPVRPATAAAAGLLLVGLA